MGVREFLRRVLDIKPEVKTEIQYVPSPPERVVEYKIIELDKPRPLIGGWDKESRETVMTLAAHPGFLILTDRLKIQAALLKQKLEQDKHKSLGDAEFLQSGIFWCKWLSSQLSAATTRASATMKDAMKEDEEAFKELQATLVKIE